MTSQEKGLSTKDIFSYQKNSICPSHLLLRVNIKEESVEMFVYLTMGIWRGLDENKLYSTLVRYGVGTEHANIAHQYK